MIEAGESTGMLAELMPRNLDGVIRKQRDRVALGLATEVELQALAARIPDGQLKDIIDDWRLVSLRDLNAGVAHVILLGYSQFEATPWTTSAVTALDQAAGLVRTRSGSLYSLGVHGEGEPDSQQLIHLCATLHHWGSGPLLGVPHFFY